MTGRTGSVLALCSAMVLIGQGPVAAGPFDEAEPFADRMQEMPWYDAPADDYRDYTAEEVRKYIPEEDDPSPEMPVPGQGGPVLPPGVQEILLIVFLGVIVFFAAYLAYRWYTERELGRKAGFRAVAANQPEVFDLPGIALAPGETPNLPERIRVALKEGHSRLAAALIFVFVLLEFSARGLLELRKSRTPRAYARLVGGDDSIPAALRDLFGQSAAAFEIAVYGESAPGLDLGDLWGRLSVELGGAESPA